MATRISDLTVEEFRQMILDTVREAFENVAEDMMALQSPGYLDSIREARRDFQEGRTQSLDEFLADE